MAPSLFSRSRNEPQTFNKEQGSNSTISLPRQVNGMAQRPATSNGTTHGSQSFSQSMEHWPQGQQHQQHEMMQNKNQNNMHSNMKAMEKNQGMSLRKRFFSSSKSATPTAMMPNQMNNSAGMAMRDKMGMMPPNGNLDMMMVMRAIEEK
jgi:hypothetical protein